jgi:outer membrane receptor protein involved in Fe transport
VVSPPNRFRFSPVPTQTFRLSYSRAFRAPSLVNNYLDITILNLVVLPPIPGLSPQPIPLIFPSVVTGNVGLQEERLDAYEVGYVGTLAPGLTLTAAAYRNETKDSIDFFTASTYGAANPPPGWPFPAFLLAVPPPNGFAGLFPSAFSYRNVGQVVDRGVEVSLDRRPGGPWSWFVNYSWQDDPEVEGIPEDEINLPPTHRANLAVGYDAGRWFANSNVNYVDEAFWTDVLDSRFHGPTDAFTQVNLGLGVRLANERVTLTLEGNNVFDEDVQQHVFGDVLERKVLGKIRIDF